MIRVSANNFLLILLILSCVVSGVMFEGVFFAVLLIMLYKNKEDIAKDKFYKVFILIVVLYIVLLVNTLYIQCTAVGWRPIGITKVLCGISVCVLINDRVSKAEYDDVYIKFLVLFNLLYCFLGIPSENPIALFRYLDYPGQNTLGALNIIALPHIVRTYKGRMTILRIVYFVTYALFFVKNIGSTTIISTSIIAVWVIYDYLKSKIHFVHLWKTKKRHILIPAAVAALVVAFFVNKNIQQTYLNMLELMDIDRYNILNQAIYRITTATPQQLLWGRGDNNFYMLSGRYIVAHNFIVEVITFEGLAALAVLVLETFVFAKFVLKKMEDTSAKSAVILSLLLGYLFFMLHPVYTTSFLVKIYLVLMNLRVCYATKNTMM